jgi:glucokinase
MRMGDLLLNPARKSLREEALPQALAVCSIVPATLGERIGDVAALCVAIDAGAGWDAETGKEAARA